MEVTAAWLLLLFSQQILQKKNKFHDIFSLFFILYCFFSTLSGSFRLLGAQRTSAGGRSYRPVDKTLRPPNLAVFVPLKCKNVHFVRRKIIISPSNCILFIVIYIFTGCTAMHFQVKFVNVKRDFSAPPYLLLKIGPFRSLKMSSARL